MPHLSIAVQPQRTLEMLRPSAATAAPEPRHERHGENHTRIMRRASWGVILLALSNIAPVLAEAPGVVSDSDYEAPEGHAAHALGLNSLSSYKSSCIDELKHPECVAYDSLNRNTGSGKEERAMGGSSSIRAGTKAY